jgi:hypothetical protein
LSLDNYAEITFEAASKSIDLTTAIATASSRGGIFDRCHLWRLESTLKSQPDLLAAMNEVFSSPTGTSLSSNLTSCIKTKLLVFELTLKPNCN